MRLQHHHTPIGNKGLSRRQLLRAGLWGALGWASWSVVSRQRSLVLGPTPAQASEQPRNGGTLTMWTQGDPPNFDLHQNSTFMASWAMAPCYNQLVQFNPLEPTKIVPAPAARAVQGGHQNGVLTKWPMPPEL
jgi:ABC-type transport system substrate-binding protein